MGIKVELDVNINQRALLLSALVRRQSGAEESEHDDLENLIQQVAKSKCGDEYCSYCGDKRYDFECDGGDNG